jgi:hypothetical protein
MTGLNEILASVKGLEVVNPPANPPRRLLLQGEGGTGKTIASCTFPNPIFLEMENTLNQHKDTLKEIHNIDINTIKRVPFWREDYAMEYLKGLNQTGTKAKINGIVNRKLAILNWIQNEAVKLPPEVTLVVDSWTRIQEACDHWTDANPVITQGQAVDKFAFWKEKQGYSERICNVLEKLPCNLVVICHEMPEWADGAPTGKILPLQQGGFQGKLKTYFPDVYRSVFVPKLDPVTKKPLVDELTGKKRGDYMWQTASGGSIGGDNRTFDSKCSIVGLKAFVAANYMSLVKLEDE